MRQRLVALIAAGLLLLFAVPAATAADCELAAGFATLKALIDEAEGPDKVGTCLENRHVNPRERRCPAADHRRSARAARDR